MQSTIRHHNATRAMLALALGLGFIVASVGCSKTSRGSAIKSMSALSNPGDDGYTWAGDEDNNPNNPASNTRGTPASGGFHSGAPVIASLPGNPGGGGAGARNCALTVLTATGKAGTPNGNAVDFTVGDVTSWTVIAPNQTMVILWTLHRTALDGSSPETSVWDPRTDTKHGLASMGATFPWPGSLRRDAFVDADLGVYEYTLKFLSSADAAATTVCTTPVFRYKVLPPAAAGPGGTVNNGPMTITGNQSAPWDTTHTIYKFIGVNVTSADQMEVGGASCPAKHTVAKDADGVYIVFDNVDVVTPKNCAVTLVRTADGARSTPDPYPFVAKLATAAGANPGTAPAQITLTSLNLIQNDSAAVLISASGTNVTHAVAAKILNCGSPTQVFVSGTAVIVALSPADAQGKTCTISLISADQSESNAKTLDVPKPATGNAGNVPVNTVPKITGMTVLQNDAILIVRFTGENLAQSTGDQMAGCSNGDDVFFDGTGLQYVWYHPAGVHGRGCTLTEFTGQAAGPPYSFTGP